VHVDSAVLGYISRLAQETRTSAEVRLGVSMRGALAYVRVAKTWAAAQGRNFVTPDDVKALAHPVLDHRLLLDPEAEFAGATVAGVVDRIISDVQPPADRAA
jgi:MoxR-like ATPase